MTSNIKPGQVFAARVKKSDRSKTLRGFEAAGRVIGPFTCTGSKEQAGTQRIVIAGDWQFLTNRFDCYPMKNA